MSRAIALIVLLMMASATALAAPTQPQDPIIAVVSTPNVDCFAFATPPEDIRDKVVGCTESYYVRWLEASGARVVNFPWNASGPLRDKLLASVNGVLFPGGGLGGQDFIDYVRYASYILDYAERRNAAGDPFFVHGTCQGFQVISVWAANNRSVLTTGEFPGLEPLMMSLNFTSYRPQSRLFGDKATNGTFVVDYLTNYPTTLNWHESGVQPQDAAANPLYGQRLSIISTNTDPTTSAEFISSVEGNNMNLIALQWHAERPAYEFSNDGVAHDIRTINVAQYVSRFIVEHLRLNNHSFASSAEAEAHMIENNPSVNQGFGEVVYWFTA